MNFEFATATRIVFGPETFRQAGVLAAGLGRRALVLHGRSDRHLGPLRGLLAEAGRSACSLSVPGEPELATVSAGVALAQAERCDLVISIGGGSVIDAGKAVAAMLANPGDLMDYLEVIGRGQALPNASAPFMAIPTTAGTGSEVTRNAVLASPAHRVKVSLRSAGMLPRVALVDPLLTVGLPPAVTAATGLDALTQLIEPFVCNRANPMIDAVCREGLARANRSLRAAFRDGGNAAAREGMSVASLFGGLALANAGLGAVHGFAGPIGGMFPAPHGAVCAALLPHVMEVNWRALRRLDPGGARLGRFDEIARILTGAPTATAEDGMGWVAELVRELGIPGLGAYGVTQEDTAAVVEKAMASSSMKANPVALTREELTEILERALAA